MKNFLKKHLGLIIYIIVSLVFCLLVSVSAAFLLVGCLMIGCLFIYFGVKVRKRYKEKVAEIEEQEELNLEIASEFLVMASTLLLIKSKGLLPKEVEDEAELTEEELLERIAKYKMYKELQPKLREMYTLNFGAFEKMPENINILKHDVKIIKGKDTSAKFKANNN